MCFQTMILGMYRSSLNVRSEEKGFQAVVSGLQHQHHPAAAFLIVGDLNRNLADFELVDLVMRENENVSIII
jgi:hypothetical protein